MNDCFYKEKFTHWLQFSCSTIIWDFDYTCLVWNFLLNLMSVGLRSTIVSVQLLVLNTIHKQRFNTMHVCLLYRSNDLEGEKGGTVMCCVDTIVCIPMHDRCKHLYLFCFGACVNELLFRCLVPASSLLNSA